jgi:hypothetical protein
VTETGSSKVFGKEDPPFKDALGGGYKFILPDTGGTAVTGTAEKEVEVDGLVEGLTVGKV